MPQRCSRTRPSTRKVQRSALFRPSRRGVYSRGTRRGGAMETLLVNGQIIDGSGAKAYVGDVLLRDDRIAAVGKDLSAKADEIVDLEGLVLAPGFIDIH